MASTDRAAARALSSKKSITEDARPTGVATSTEQARPAGEGLLVDPSSPPHNNSIKTSHTLFLSGFSSRPKISSVIDAISTSKIYSITRYRNTDMLLLVLLHQAAADTLIARSPLQIKANPANAAPDLVRVTTLTTDTHAEIPAGATNILLFKMLPAQQQEDKTSLEEPAEGILTADHDGEAVSWSSLTGRSGGNPRIFSDEEASRLIGLGVGAFGPVVRVTREYAREEEEMQWCVEFMGIQQAVKAREMVVERWGKEVEEVGYTAQVQKALFSGGGGALRPFREFVPGWISHFTAG